MKMKKERKGHYTVKVDGTLVSILKNEDSSDVVWSIFWGEYGDEDYWSDSYNTLKEAKNSLKAFLENKSNA